LLALAATICLFSGPAAAQDSFPERPITMIVPWAPGGVTDIMVRALSKGAEKHLGQTIVILNKPSAGNVVGLTELSQAKPDGYTVGPLSSTGYVFPITGKQVPYDILKSFTYVSYFGDNLLGVVVRSDAPWQSLKDLIEDGKKNPGKFKFGTPGVGTTQHLMMEGIMIDTGSKFIHVPQVGSAAVNAALLGGNLDFSSDASSWAPLAMQGQFRVLAVSTPSRSAAFPDAPTMSQLGFRASRSVGAIIAPAGVPEPIRLKLEDAFRKAVSEPEAKAAFEKLAMTPIEMSGPQARALVETEMKLTREIWEKIKK
jgi:tripartite-type tricarboxylate transporter receptor subunit TctC